MGICGVTVNCGREDARTNKGGDDEDPDWEYKFQSRESAAVKKHNRLSILKCSDVLHYNKNVTRGLCVRGNIVSSVCMRSSEVRTSTYGGTTSGPVKQLMGRKRFSAIKKALRLSYTRARL